MNYKNNLSDAVFREINSRRQKAENDFFEYNRLLEKDEVYADYKRKINKLNRLIGFSIADKDETQEKELRLEKEQTLQEFNDYCKKKNVTVRPFPTYYCPLCKDVGYTSRGYCDCFKKLYSKLCLEELGIGEKKLSDFNDDTLSEKYLKAVYDSLKISISDFNNFPCYLFTGFCGSGKTFLAQCTAKELEKKGYSTLFLTSFELNNLFIKYHSAPIDEKDFYFSVLTECDLLVIDDLGTEPIYQKITLEYLFMLFSERKKNKKPFIVTTNLNLKEILLRYGERIFSRLIQQDDTKCIDFGNNNLRTVKNGKE